MAETAGLGARSDLGPRGGRGRVLSDLAGEMKSSHCRPKIIRLRAQVSRYTDRRTDVCSLVAAWNPTPTLLVSALTSADSQMVVIYMPTDYL